MQRHRDSPYTYACATAATARACVATTQAAVACAALIAAAAAVANGHAVPHLCGQQHLLKLVGVIDPYYTLGHRTCGCPCPVHPQILLHCLPTTCVQGMDLRRTGLADVTRGSMVGAHTRAPACALALTCTPSPAHVPVHQVHCYLSCNHNTLECH
jgi:hypothetical protein